MKKAVKAAKTTAQVVWLGLATLVGVALLFRLAPIFLGGRDSPETATAEAEPLGEPGGSPAPVVDQGSWMVVADERDPMDGSPYILVALASHDADDVSLTVGCSDNDTDVMVMWGEYLGSSRSITIVHRFPPAPAQRSAWFGSGTTTIKRGVPMVRELADNPELIVRTTPYSGETVTATFDLTGAREAIGKIASACGWEL